MNDPTIAEYSDWQHAMTTGTRSMQGGDVATALQAFDTAVTKWPEHESGWINFGTTLIHSRQYLAAANAMGQAVERHPGSAHCYTLLADASRMLGRRQVALECYEEAVRLDRSPENLNRLGLLSGTFGEHDKALALFNEALESDPGFNLARINRGTLYIERQEFDTALSELRALDPATLLPPERQVLSTTLAAMEEYERLGDRIAPMIDSGDVAPLAAALADLSPQVAEFDRAALKTVAIYAKRVGTLTLPDCPLDVELPEDWALLEALHMIPYVRTVDEFVALRSREFGEIEPGGNLFESLAMEAAVVAASTCREDMLDPPLGEAHLRHWHSLCCRGVAGFMPGHFKYTQNGSARNPSLPRVNPASASGTIQFVLERIYPKMAPGLARGMVAFLALMDLHAFADGNGRVAMTWLNRELIWAGQMPALFTREHGFRGTLGEAIGEVRNNGGDLAPVIAAIGIGQAHARTFCRELADR